MSSALANINVDSKEELIADTQVEDVQTYAATLNNTTVIGDKSTRLKEKLSQMPTNFT